MAFWEFLLQKEGDRSWLPLESPQVEVLEGKYRVVARSSRTDTSVEIRIIHDATAELPPVRRTQKRHGKTNREGLIVVMPFTRLLPGTWQLRCMSDVMSDLMGSGWEYALHLHVLPIEPDIHDEWDSDWGEGVTAAEGVGFDPASELSALPQPEPIAATESPSEAPMFAELLQSDSTPTEANGETLSEEFAGSLTNNTNKRSETHSPSRTSTQAQPDGPDHASDHGLDHISPDAPPITSAGEASNLLPLVPRSTDDRPSSLQETAAQPAQEVVDSFRELENSTEASAPQPVDRAIDRESRSPEHSLGLARSHPNTLPLRLDLGQETYVAQRGQAVTLTGQVASIDELLTYELLPVESLEIRLYDPRTSRILVEKRQPLTARRLPFPFTCRITLPEHYQTYLVLGELVLYGAADGDVPPPVLAIQSFNVTTDLHELIEAIANDYIVTEDAELDLPLPPEAAPTSAERDHRSNVSFPTPSQAIAPEISFKASSQQPLPPQLHPSSPEPFDRPNRPLELPSFNQVTADDQEGEPSDADALDLNRFDSESLDPLDSDLDDPIAASATESGVADWGDKVDPLGQAAANAPGSNATAHSPLEADLDRPSNLPESEASGRTGTARLVHPPAMTIETFKDEPIPDWDTNYWQSEPTTATEKSVAATADSAEPDSPEQAAFRALNLQDRFWERLQSLVVDRELSHWLEVLQAEEVGEMDESDSSIAVEEGSTFPLGKLKRRPIGRDAQLAAQEVLAEDELELGSTPAAASIDSHQPAMTLVLPIDEPVPVPELNAPSGELTAGQTLTVTVKLPDSQPQIFVKLWLSERQSRSILDAPRWLTEFLPDGFGDLLTRTELTVPHGCVEIQVEAIAVEMATQRESDKVTLVRKVIPANWSSYSFDELDV
ncbi:hypothetical protein [Egbenema bharatensis]|uniref:hypothetical protein n=1 Tax=Egbenema bharatensis TaxID=3463334 RepID=UPI003A86D5A3